MSLFSTPGSIFIKVTLLKSRQRHCSQHPDFALKWTIVAGRQHEAQTIKFPTAHTLLGKPMVFKYCKQHYLERRSLSVWLVLLLENVLPICGAMVIVYSIICPCMTVLWM